MGVRGQHHTPAAFYPGERTPGTHCTGGWVGPSAGLDTETRGNPLPLPGIQPRSPGRPARSQTLLPSKKTILLIFLIFLRKQLTSDHIFLEAEEDEEM
jgi:hypothetical protein